MNGMMGGHWGIALAESARKHGFGRMDALYAIKWARLGADPFESSRIAGTIDPAGWIGPAVDGTEVEVFAEVDHDAGTVWIFHMMPARPHIIRKIEKAMKEQNR